MPIITLTEAASIAKVAVSTIARAVNAGKLSAKILNNGQKGIDPVELERVFPSDAPRRRNQRPVNGNAKSMIENAQQNRMAPQNAMNATNTESVLDHALVRSLSERCADLQKQLDREAARVDELTTDNRRMALLLEDDRRKALLLLEDKRHPPQEVQRIASKPTEPAHRFEPPKMAKAATGRDKKHGKSGKTQKGRKK